jgi:autotransporter-associated beta strand protein
MDVNGATAGFGLYNNTPLYVWDSNSSSIWTTSAAGTNATSTWSTLGGGDSTITEFNLSNSTASSTVQLGGNFSVQGLKFTSTGSRSLTLNATSSRVITLSPGATIEVSGSVSAVAFGFNATLSGNFTKTGNNLLNLEREPYQGSITVNAGELWLGNPGVSKTSIHVSLNGTSSQLNLNNSGNYSIGNLSGNGTVRTSAGGNYTLTIAPATDQEFTGQIINRSAANDRLFNITKNGSATLALSGNNTFTGATVINAGTLSIATIANGGIRLTGNYVSSNAVVTANSTAGLSVNMTVVSTSATARQRINSISGATFTMNANSSAAGTNVVTRVGFANGLGLSDSTATNLQIGNATLRYTGATASTDRNFTLINGTTAGIDVSQAATTLTMSGSAATTTGAFNKLGNGTLVFSGNHSYTGATTISAGTLSIANIANGGSASGLGNSTSAAANLVLNGGTLNFTGASASSNRSFTLANSTSSGIRVDNGATVLTLSGTSAAASSNLAKLGDGTLVFSGNHSYTGSTTISAGTLQIGAGGASGSIESTSGVSNNATLVFNRNDSTGFSKAISGTGNLTQAGSGTLTLTGANSYSGATSITAGTLTLGAGGTLGSSTVDIAAGAVLSLGRTDVFTVANNISGAGTLRQSAAGTATLSGVNTNTGIVEAAAGTLLFSGANALSSSVSSLNATGGSTLSFADGTASTTTLSTGSVAVASSNLVFDIGTTADQLVLSSGAASLTSATLKLNFLEQITSAQSWTLLSAAGGLSGSWTLDQTFTGASQSGSFVFSLQSDATSLTLVASANSNNAYWTGNTNGSWNTAANWSSDAAGNTPLGSVPGSAADVILTATGAQNLSTALGQDFTVNKVTISESGVTIASGNTLTANASSPSAFTISSAGATTIAADLAGAGAGLLKSGAGSLTLSGANTYGGGTTLTGGTLQISSDVSLGATSGTLSIDPGVGSTATVLTIGNTTTSASRAITLASGTAQFDTDGQLLEIAGIISGSGNLRKVGVGTLTLSGANTFVNSTTVSGGTLALSGGSAIVDSGTIILNNTAGVELSILSSETIRSLQGGGASGGDTRIASNQTLTIAETGTVTYDGRLFNNGTLAMSGAGSLTASGQISGSGSIAMVGSGILTLSGNNTFSGGATLNAGTLAITNANALGSTGTISFGGGTLQYGSGVATDLSPRIGMGAGQAVRIDTNSNIVTYSSAITGSGGTLTKLGAGTLSLAGNNTFSAGAITISAGTLQIGSSGLLGGGAYSGNISNSSTFDYAGSANQTLSGVISGTGALSVSGGGLLNLTGNNTYTGATSLTSGALRINGNATLSSNTTITVSNGAALQMAGNATINNAISLSGEGVGGTGALRNISGSNRVVPNITLLGNTSIQSDSGIFFTTGALVGTNTNLTLTGAGNFQINAVTLGTGSLIIALSGSALANVGITNSNAYTGDTIIQSGEFRLARANAIPTASNVVISGGTLNIQTHLQTSANVTLVSGNITGTTGALTATNGFILQNGTVSAILAGNSTVTKTGVGTVTLSGNNTYNGGTTISVGTLQLGSGGTTGSLNTASAITNNGTLAFNRSNTVTQGTDFAPVITGTGALIQAGSGNLILTGANTYTGTTTVNSGTLQANASGALGSTANITVNGGSLLVGANNAINDSASINLAGGTLAFVGNVTETIGALTLSANSVIDLGTGSVVAHFAAIAGLNNYILKIYNWTGTTLWGGANRDNTDQIYVSTNLNDSELSRISFYSDFGNSFLGTGYQLSGSGFYDNQVIPVPEPEVWLTALLLLGSALFWKIRQPKKCTGKSACSVPSLS